MNENWKNYFYWVRNIKNLKIWICEKNDFENDFENRFFFLSEKGLNFYFKLLKVSVQQHDNPSLKSSVFSSILDLLRNTSFFFSLPSTWPPKSFTSFNDSLKGFSWNIVVKRSDNQNSNAKNHSMMNLKQEIWCFWPKLFTSKTCFFIDQRFDRSWLVLISKDFLSPQSWNGRKKKKMK